MAANYDPSLTSDLDKVRFRVGDVDVANALVPDETIEALLQASGASVLSVAADLASMLAAKYANSVDTDLDNQGFKYSQRAKQFSELAARLRAEDAAARVVIPPNEDPTDRVAMGGGVIALGTSTSEVIDALNDPENLDNFHRWMCR
ncbi:hypothetical protein CPT_Sansa29 [Caulobacter phage Sansa]|uniref:Uncharacterized protein n=1 Tax=Caulobacter phage Sansa TaxID=1675600 RepID=A0A0K1LML8_9CAUD|nr:hypothetical protein HOR07_gp029 [Caulobacter phage Sansa]AKU43433.1 hypothetical protein CPT_Sansa29 [Caulobacter phage Sansa]